MKRSKKLVLLLYSCIWGLPLQAQESLLPTGFTTGDNVWIVKAGLTVNNVSGDGVLATKANWAATNGTGEFENALGGKLYIGICVGCVLCLRCQAFRLYRSRLPS